MKKVILVAVIIVAVIITAWMLKFSWSCIKNEAIDFIFNQLEKEEQIRQEKIANGELVPGKDTALIWGNMYEIGKYGDNYMLSADTDGLIHSILEYVTGYEKKGGKLYVIAEDGYAVIDEKNLCTVYWFNSEKEVPTYNTEKGMIKKVTSFSEFSESDQSRFNKLLK